MSVYIRGMGCISPQKSWESDALRSDPLVYHGERVVCYEPDYSKIVDPRQLRRMSRIIKMGFAAGSMALKEADVTVPNGIVTGTGYGCLDDTGVFLSKMIENNEQALNPTPFIQSTHNTIGSQIALLLQCQGYNQTYAQGAFSFENALLDAVLALSDEPELSLLVGGVDEITPTSHAIQRRFGIFRNATSNVELFKANGKGTINGEGATFFVLSGQKQPTDRVCIEGLTTIHNATDAQIKREIGAFLKGSNLSAKDVDLVLLGSTGDKRWDAVTQFVSTSYFGTSSVGVFKHLCGEYPTASAFALWLSAKMIAENLIPDTVVVRNANRPLKRLLIFNTYFGKQHSLILLRAC
jgi:3-oxoacyl-(acyl-carrier-protein) synthase